MYIMQYKCRSKTFDLGCIMSTNLLLFWVCNVFSCVASLWSFTGSSLRCSKTNRYVWTQTLHGSKLYGDFFLHINFKIPCSIKELFGESRFSDFRYCLNWWMRTSLTKCPWFFVTIFILLFSSRKPSQRTKTRNCGQCQTTSGYNVVTD